MYCVSNMLSVQLLGVKFCFSTLNLSQLVLERVKKFTVPMELTYRIEIFSSSSFLWIIYQHPYLCLFSHITTLKGLN
jgi:hypothetical protein